MTLRLLITGSRSWTDRDIIATALQETWEAYGSPADAVMVNGRCPKGADLIGEQEWVKMGLVVEPYPAEWDKYPRGAAGPIRNKQMVDTGADICLAFIVDGSVGAMGCAKLAEKANIPVRLYKSTWQEQHPGEEENPVEVKKREERLAKETVKRQKQALRQQREEEKREQARLEEQRRNDQGKLF